jgi:hypothetical protein
MIIFYMIIFDSPFWSYVMLNDRSLARSLARGHPLSELRNQKGRNPRVINVLIELVFVACSLYVVC